jgi:hypothetical protein
MIPMHAWLPTNAVVAVASRAGQIVCICAWVPDVVDEQAFSGDWWETGNVRNKHASMQMQYTSYTHY